MVWDTTASHTDRRSEASTGSASPAELAHLREELASALSQSQATTARVRVEPHETIRSIGREVYELKLGRLPSDLELKAFVDNTARLSQLKTDQQRNDLWQGEPLTIEVPASKRGDHRTGSGCFAAKSENSLIAGWITHNEAGQKLYTAYNPNDNGEGVSVGLMQWNQKRGRLPDLLEAWHTRDPAKFDKIFGSNADHLLHANWVRWADFSTVPQLSNELKTALKDREFQLVQLQLRNDRVEQSGEIAHKYGFTSLRARALIADLINQLGAGGTESDLRKIPSSRNESARIERLEKVTRGRIGSSERVGTIEDRVHEIWRRLDHEGCRQ